MGIYVHIPFCEAKCTYCHFAIDPRRPDGERQERYVRAVLAEMEATEAGPADTLYFGGGTPSLLAPERLSRVVEAARRRFALAPGAGFSNLSLDLILGWPGETRERWGWTLDGSLALDPDHVSLYLLEVEGRTVLGHRQGRGRLDLPDDDLVADLYQETAERLAAHGLDRYEISNFARPGFESRHNGKYWDDAPFFGFGMAAHSYRHGRRSWNHDRFATYCRAVEGGSPGAAMAGERVLSPRDRAAEALFTGLRRREGVALGGFRDRYGLDPVTEWAEGLGRASNAGLVEARDGRLRLTNRGVLLSNEVFGVFV